MEPSIQNIMQGLQPKPMVKTHYVLNIDGQKKKLSHEEFSNIVKHKLMNSIAVRKVCKDFDVRPDLIKDIIIEVCDLSEKDRYAETDSECMRINKNLLEDEDFFETKMFIIVHESIHFYSRIREPRLNTKDNKRDFCSDPDAHDHYLCDIEEILGFVISVAYELERGTSKDVIWTRIYPKIDTHFASESDSREFFQNMFEKAQKILSQ